MRIKSSIYNSLSNILILISTTIMSFVARTIFIKILGNECIGVDGLFTNILSMLSVTELGIGTAINFSLYEPLAKKNNKKINQIMGFYKHAYRYIGMAIFIIGIIVMFNLRFIVKDSTVDNLYLIYFLYLLNTVSIYFISYKDILLAADQKYYKLNALRTIFIFVIYGLQCIFLFITKNYVVYLLIMLMCRILERVLINIYITKKYSQIHFKSEDKLDKKEINKITTNVKGMVFHKAGNYFLSSTDNILISALVNITTVGIYSNYLALVSVARNFISTLLSGVTSSFGNLIVSNDIESQERVFKIMNFVNFLICGYVTICFLNMLTPFVNLWLGNKYITDEITTVVICSNFYFYCLLIPIDIVKNASGIYYVDRYIPIIQVIVNLIFSIILAPYFGLLGILLGTLISYISVIIWSKPMIIYKYLFKKPVKQYYLSQLKNIGIILIVYLVSLLIELFNFKYSIIYLIIRTIIYFIIFIIAIIIFYHKNDEYKYIMDLIKKFFKKGVRK